MYLYHFRFRKLWIVSLTNTHYGGCGSVLAGRVPCRDTAISREDAKTQRKLLYGYLPSWLTVRVMPVFMRASPKFRRKPSLVLVRRR
jgi:hypothetical protein